MHVRLVAGFAAALATATAARAQTEDDLTVTLNPGHADGYFIGIDDCRSEAEREFRIEGTAARVAAGDYDLRLTWTRTGTPCSWDQFAVCPGRTQDDQCGCLKEVDTGTNVSTTFVLDDLVPDICTAGGETEIRFYLEYRRTPSADDQQAANAIHSKTPQSIFIDLERPPAPTGVPEVAAADSALVISIEHVDNEEDVARYEVCVAPVSADDPGTGGADADGSDSLVSNEDLRTPFVESDCERVSKDDGSVRVDGLENDVQYRVVYATVDAAGNRSANSREARGTPREVLDFAEYYAGRWGGGEQGGCRSATARTLSPAALLMTVGLLLLGPVTSAVRRRRSR